jgi:hypothetical protein
MNVTLPLKLLLIAFGIGNRACTHAKVLTADDAGIETPVTTRATTETVHHVDVEPMMQSNQTTNYSYTLYATFSTRREMSHLTAKDASYFDKAIRMAYQQTQQKLHNNNTADAGVNLTSVQILQQSREDRHKNKESNHGGHRGRRLTYRYAPYYYRYDYRLFFDFRCNLCGEKSGFWDRRLLRLHDGEQDFVTLFQQTLCQTLRSSPYKTTFHGVHDCRIHFQ